MKVEKFFEKETNLFQKKECGVQLGSSCSEWVILRSKAAAVVQTHVL